MTSQWRHRNKTHSWYSELNSLQNVYFGFFYIWKTNRMTLFCNLFMERPSYIANVLWLRQWMWFNLSDSCWDVYKPSVASWYIFGLHWELMMSKASITGDCATLTFCPICQHLFHLLNARCKERCWLLSKPLTNNWFHLAIWCEFLPT